MPAEGGDGVGYPPTVLEQLLSLKDFHQLLAEGRGLTFDDSPLLLGDTRSQDISTPSIGNYPKRCTC